MVTIITAKQKSIKQIFNGLSFKHSNLWQFIGYLLSGSLATTVHYTILISMVEILAIHPIMASSLGFIGGAITGFCLNKNFVFCDLNAGKAACVKYLLMAGIGALLNIILLLVLTNNIHLHYLLAQLLTTISIVLCNFICCKTWIFNRGKQ